MFISWCCFRVVKFEDMIRGRCLTMKSLEPHEWKMEWQYFSSWSILMLSMWTFLIWKRNFLLATVVRTILDPVTVNPRTCGGASFSSEKLQVMTFLKSESRHPTRFSVWPSVHPRLTSWLSSKTWSLASQLSEINTVRDSFWLCVTHMLTTILEGG